jgi:ubiquinone/menaquinone biosynthesis C-methylase UbiE
MVLDTLLAAIGSRGYNSAAAYERHLRRKLREHRGNRDLAFADAIGSASIELFNSQGDVQVEVLRHYGLADGMSVYDLGCGCGRTAQALQRAGWRGRYAGADIVEGFISELKRKCPDFEAYVHRKPSIVAEDGSLDMIFHWSVFTHVPVEECFLYLEDSFRTLKPGGKLVFSFLELTEPRHYERIFENRVGWIRRNRPPKLLDTFLHRDWIALWARKIGFADPQFTDGDDQSSHPPMWQTLAAMVKPA